MQLCRLCLEESPKTQSIFKGKKIINILTKYINLEFKEDDPISSTICNECWDIIKDFNNLYIKIEKAQKRYTEIVNVSSLMVSEENIQSIKQELTYDNDLQNILTDQIKLDNSELQEQQHETEILPKGIKSFSSTLLRKIIVDQTLNEENKTIDYNNDSIKIKKETETKVKKKNKKSIVRIEKNKSDTDRNNKRISRSMFLNNEEIDKKIASFMTLSCDICSKVLPNLATLKIHFKNEHNTVGYIICCNKKFTQNHFLVGHIDHHLNPQNYKCIECNKVLSTQKNFEKHMSAKHFHKQWFNCDNCPRKFDSLNLLDRHKPIHWPKEQWILKCPQCERIYPSEHFLKAHITDIHERKNICQHCGKSFSARKFKQHQRSHTEDPENLRVQCEICGAWLKTANGYRTHMKNHKDANAIHKCELCGKISPNRSALKIHLKNHDTTRNHQCTVCEKAFKRPLALRQHMATHTGEYLYQCAYCAKTFIYDSAYHTHKKRDHPDEYEIERKKIRRTDFTKFSTILSVQEQKPNIEQIHSSSMF